MKAKCLDEPFKGAYGTYPQTIKPSHRHGSQTRWEHLTHQGLILGMDGHSLVEMAHVIHRVCSTIVNGERWLIQSPRKSCPFNLVREGQFENLVQHLAHSVISQVFARRVLIPTFVMAFLIVGERLAMWGS